MLGTGHLPLPAEPALGGTARCGAVPQPAERAAETGGVAGIGYLPLPARPVTGNAARRRGAAIGCTDGGERCDGGEK